MGKSWPEVARKFNEGTVSEAWFHDGNDLGKVLEGRRVEASSQVRNGMVTLTLTEGVMVQLFAGNPYQPMVFDLKNVADRTGEITDIEVVTRKDLNGLRRVTVLAWCDDEYGNVDNDGDDVMSVLFEVVETEAAFKNDIQDRTFNGVAFRQPSTYSRFIGGDK